MIRRLPMINLLTIAVIILAPVSLTQEGSAKSTAPVWPSEEKGMGSSKFREPICISEAVYQISREHGIPPKLVQAIIQVESQGNTRATSPKGALGLMQLMPEVLKAHQVGDPFDPVANVRAGVKHLNYLLLEFSGNLPLSLAAYNAGPHTVRKYRGIPPYPETRRFLRNVLREYQSQVHEPTLLAQTLRVKGILSSSPLQAAGLSNGVKKIESTGKISRDWNPGDLTVFLQKARIPNRKIGIK